jgi:hypothetical protein
MAVPLSQRVVCLEAADEMQVHILIQQNGNFVAFQSW